MNNNCTTVTAVELHKNNINKIYFFLDLFLIYPSQEDAAQHSSIVPLVSYDEIILDVSTVSFGTLQTIAIDVQV